MQINGQRNPTLQPNNSFQDELVKRSYWFIGFVLLVALMILVEWQFGINFLRQPIASVVATNPTTALCFVFLSCAFFLGSAKKHSRVKTSIGNIFIVAVFIIGCLKLISTLANVNVSIDTVLFREELMREAVNFPLNQMSSFTAFNFLLLATALFIFSNVKYKMWNIPAYLSLFAWFIALMFIIGYAYRVDEFHRLLSKIPMSLTTASCFVITSAGFLLANPTHGFMFRLTSELAGGVTAKILVPVAIITPFIIGFFRMLAEWNNLFTCGMGAALLVTGIIAVFLVIIYYTAGILNHKDELKVTAENNLRALNEHLEQRVNERTHELKRKNKALSLSEHKYRNLYENSLVAIFTTDIKTLEVITVNDVGYRLFGYASKKEFLENFHPLRHFADPSERERNIKVITEKREMKNKVQEMKKLDGTRFWAKIFAKLNPESNVVETVIVDITPQIEAQESLALKVRELESANKELELFNYISSHDLQEPLRKIKMFTNVLLSGEEKNLSSQGQHYLGRMADTAGRLQMLLDDLLTYSHTKKKDVVFEETDLKQLFEEVLPDFKDAIIEKGATIKIEDLCTLEVVKFQIRLLFTNLVSNSIKFASPQRPLKISLSSEVKQGKKFNKSELSEWVFYCHIIFKDNGIGFEPQYNKRIFDIFEKLHSEERYAGTGIGLAICKRIVENHNGIIEAFAEPNHGAQFDIYIPVKR